MRSATPMALALCCLLTASSLGARSKRHGRSSRSAATFDFYLLALSYVPDFCSEPGGQKDPLECGVGRKFGFVVHGLWPQSEAGKGPMNCGGSPVSQSLVQLMLNYIPTASLIQHEWSTHGTCSGLSAKDYFALVRKAKDSLKIPADVAKPASKVTFSPSNLDADFARANASYPKDSFRSTCYNDAELQEVRVCLTKDLAPRSCPATVPDCTRSPITLLPVH